ncbi:hypothetical protein BKA70DRAFT_1417234 [Coprinopsis sp. MPI-PUGE-AT-0042]|nr:hypothetical protein BKA70DRAFT_1417234 [Coprinopsis sp. MPI-PUGE-AT-0042]
MVQFKASSLVLVAAIAGFAQTSVLARRSNVREYREDGLSSREFREQIIRAVVKEALLERSFNLESSELSRRDSEDLEQRSPEPVTNFFKGIGQFVKRVFHQYWREMQDDVRFLDLRRIHPHPEANFRSRRHRMEGDQMDARNDADDFRSRRRRYDNGRLVRRSYQEDFRDRRRRFSDGQVIQRHHQDDYRDRRRRFSQGHIVRGAASSPDDVLATREDQELLPRMSWYGKALLIYRDMKHPTSELVSRTTSKLESRDWRSLDDLD